MTQRVDDHRRRRYTRTMDTRVCNKCGEEKLLTDFHRHPHSKDGRLRQCKACSAQYQRDNIEKTRVYGKRYYQKHREAILERRREYQRRNPRIWSTRPRTPRVVARDKACHEARMGRIIRDKCVVCGQQEGTEFHHEDYGKPLEVVSICQEHHRDIHCGRLCLLTATEVADT